MRDEDEKEVDLLNYEISYGYWQHYMSGYYGNSRGSGSCGDSGSCDGSGSGCKKEEPPCTCSDEQYEIGVATGTGFSESCPYHKQWRATRRKKEARG